MIMSSVNWLNELPSLTVCSKQRGLLVFDKTKQIELYFMDDDKGGFVLSIQNGKCQPFRI